MHRKQGRELVVRSNVYWLEAKFPHSKADNKLLCNVDRVDMRARENQAD